MSSRTGRRSDALPRLRRLLLTAARWVVRLPALTLILFFRAWQLIVSPHYGQTCRFYPSCSAYGVQAVREHGAVRGSWLTARRLLRCNPWNPGGVDPVPPNSRSAHSVADHDESVPLPRRVA